MSLIGNPDTPASYVADYMQACVGMLGIPAGGFTADIEAYGAATNWNVESLYAAMLNGSIGRSIYSPGASNATLAAKLVDKLGGSLLASATKTSVTDLAKSMLDGGDSLAKVCMTFVEAVAGISTTDPDYGTVAQQFANRITIADFYTFNTTSPSSTLSTLNNVLSGVTNTTNVSDPQTYIDTALPGTSGQTYTLTTSVDTIVGTAYADTINASNTTSSAVLGGLDSIDGGAGSDILNVTDTSIAATAAFTLPAGLAVKNVETVNVTANGSLGDTAATAFDLTGMTGLTTFNGVTAGDGTKKTSVKASDTTAVNLTVGAADTPKVVGGSSVSVTGGAGATVSDGGNKALTSVTLTKVDGNSGITSNGLTTLTVGGATTAARTVTVTNTTTGHSLTVNAAGTGYKADGTTAVQTVVTDTAATSATVNTTAKSSLDLSGSTAVKSLTLTGSGNLTLAAMGATTTSIDGSAATGNLSLGSLNAAATTVKTGAGADTFTLGATTKATVDTGAGNDTVTLGGALASGSSVSLGAGDDHVIGTTAVAYSSTNLSVIDGGDGTDTVSAQLINAGNAAQFKNFEGLSLNSTTGLDVALLTGNTISTLYIDAATTTATYQNLTKDATLNVTYVDNTGTTTAPVANAGKTNTLSMTGVSGTSDSYTITFAGDNSSAASAPTVANVAAGTIAVAGIENFSIVSGGTKAWNQVKLGTDTAAQTVTITGASNLDLAFASFGSTTSPNTGVSLIDGSAATGKLAINLSGVTAASAGITVKGGTAADTLTASTFATTMTGGAGNDTFDATLAVSTAATAPVLTTITDAAAGDIIKLSATGTSVFTTTKVDVSTATALALGTVNALDLASTAAGNVNNQIKWFVYGGNTYIIDHVTAATTAYGTNDQVVKLVGVYDLSTATWSDASASLTLA